MKTRAMIGAVFALTAVLASPAFAKSAHAADQAEQNYEHWLTEPHSTHPGWDVYNDRGRYRGTDPDPFIRSQLERCREC